MRQLTRVLLLCLLVILGGWVGFFVLFGEDETPVLRVVRASGAVRRDGPEADDGPLVEGEPLHAQDRVVVGADGVAILGLGEETRLQLEPDSAIRVLEADLAGVRIELEEGRVVARVKPARGGVGLSSRGRAILAEDADFTAAVDGATGDLSVRTERGAVEVLGVGKPANLPAGQQLWSSPGEEVVRAPISEELLLSTRWPEADTISASTTLHLVGKTEPRAWVEVRVDEDPPRPVRAGGDGSFALDLVLAPGSRRVVVRARGALGEERAVERVLEVTSGEAPRVQTEVLWGPPSP